jgi:ferric-dicitrate binding protein FerR (iron transport regulator)
MDLWTVCNEVMDYFDVRIRLGDPALGTLSVTGAFDAHDARNVITSICLLTGRQFRNEGGTYVIY